MKKKKHSLRKNILREIKGAPGRFIAIFAISALGAGFYAGLTATGPDMLNTATHYYADTQLMDYRLLSTMGFTEEDVETLRLREDVKAVMPTHGMDFIVDFADGPEPVRFHALPENINPENPDYLNQIIITEGRMPTAANECVVDNQKNYTIGDLISLSPENNQDNLDLIAEKEFIVVGLAKSPYYISVQRGNTNIGNGRIGFFVYVPQASFDSEYYTELFVQSKDGSSLRFHTSEYENYIDDGIDSLKSFGKAQAKIRYDDIYSDANDEINDARIELANGKAEAAEKLDEALKEIRDGEKKIRDAWAEVTSNSQKLTDGKNALTEGVAALLHARTQLQAGQDEYDKGYVAYSSQKAQFDESMAGLDALQAGITAFPSFTGAMNALTNSGTAEPTEVESFNAAASASLQATGAVSQMLRTAGDFANADALDAVLNAASGQMQEGQFLNAYHTINSISSAIAGAGPAVAAAQNQLNAALPALTEAQMKLDAAKTVLDSGWAELAGGEATIEGSRLELASGEQKLEDAKKELGKAEEDLAEGRIEYYEGLEEADLELFDAMIKIADGKQELNDLDNPEWFIFGRSANPGYSGFAADADRINNIALVIPVFFFLVAALVCLTSMTRMVEEQRTQIGTLKALGFSKEIIAFKYIFYAGIATLAGSIIGVTIGYALFPPIIWEAYSMMYVMVPLVHAANFQLTATSIAATVFVTVVSTLFACISTLRSVPASLMRPKAPSSGQRVILERIPFIWKILSFNSKITFRNLFRYKGRFFMTVIGVAGCAALLLTGFGLRDSISGIVSLQYGAINHHDITISLLDPATAADDTALNNILNEYGTALYTQEVAVSAESDSGTSSSMSVYIYLPENPEALPEMMTMRDRKQAQAVAFPQADGVVLTEKLAGRLKVEVGDTLKLNRVNEPAVEVKIAGIIENYLLNYVYMQPSTYKKLFKEVPEYNMVRLKLTENDAATIDEALAKIVENDDVAGAMGISEMRKSFDDGFTSLNSVVWLIIGCAAMLAFVVLYNLTNINIAERAREIATLKVLGFYQGEVSAYVYRENIVLTIIGALVGLIMGIVLHQYVIQMAEVDEVMFRRTIQPLSYVLSFFFTLLSGFVVNLFMLKKLKDINMVESLKSVD